MSENRTIKKTTIDDNPDAASNQKVYLQFYGNSNFMGLDLFISLGDSSTGSYLKIESLRRALDELEGRKVDAKGNVASMSVDSVKRSGSGSFPSFTVTGRLFNQDIEDLGRVPTVDDVLVIEGFDR